MSSFEIKAARRNRVQSEEAKAPPQTPIESTKASDFKEIESLLIDQPWWQQVVTVVAVTAVIVGALVFKFSFSPSYMTYSVLAVAVGLAALFLLKNAGNERASRKDLLSRAGTPKENA